MGQWHCMVQGQQYGPVDDSTIREWIRAGRLQPSDNVWTEGMAEWQPAAEVPALAGSFAEAHQQAPATSPHSPSEANVYNQSPPQTPAGYAQPTMPSKPHRGGTVLTLGIIGVLCCGICAVIAWSMGSSDIKEMDAGIMDNSGRSTTQAGKILGIVGTVLWIFAIIANVGQLAILS